MVKNERVKTGDLILHGYKQKVVAISIVKADCYPAMRPDELVADWKKEGWSVDTEYLIFDNAIYPKDTGMICSHIYHPCIVRFLERVVCTPSNCQLISAYTRHFSKKQRNNSYEALKKLNELKITDFKSG